MATISRAMLMIKLNSSYVLIIITLFRKVSDWVRARPPVPRVSILNTFLTEKAGNTDFSGFPAFVEQITGIEPASPAWEAGVLPMNYICATKIL